MFFKQVVNVLSLPVTCTLLQSMIGACMAVFFAATNLADMPKMDKKTVMDVAPLAAAHTLGNLLTNVSLACVAVRERKLLRCAGALATPIRWTQ